MPARILPQAAPFLKAGILALHRAAAPAVTDEAQRLVQWRQWQLAQQPPGLAPPAPPPPERVALVPRAYPLPPPPVYPYPYCYPVPYYAPWWGVSVCAGRAYRHGFGSFCI